MGDTYSEADIAEAAGALESRGIKWAWQMCQMDKDDWNGIPTGLKCATRVCSTGSHKASRPTCLLL